MSVAMAIASSASRSRTSYNGQSAETSHLWEGTQKGSGVNLRRPNQVLCSQLSKALS